MPNATGVAPPIADLGGAWLTMLGALLIILAFLFLGYWFMKRTGLRPGFGKKGDLDIEGYLSLGPKKSVVVVRFLKKRMLLGVTEQHINLLTQVEADDDDEEKGSFADTMDAAKGGLKGGGKGG